MPLFQKELGAQLRGAAELLPGQFDSADSTCHLSGVGAV